MDKTIRVMQVVGKMNAGGVKTVVMEYYRNINRANVQFDFVVDEDSQNIDFEEIQNMGGRVFIVPRYQKLHHYIPALFRLFRKEKVEIVHARINAMNVFPLFAAWLAGVPVRIAENLTTSHPNEKKTIVKKILRPFQGVFATNRMACSEHCARWMYGNAFEKKGVTIFKTAYTIDKYSYQPSVRAAERDRLGIKDKYVIGSIGRFVPQKNHMFILQIFKCIAEQDNNAVLLLVGDGPLHDLLCEEAKRLEIFDRILWMGTQKEVWNFYQAMDCFLLPSLYEGLGIVVVQAQNSGLPCVVSDQVPLEADVTKTVAFLSLSHTAEQWATAVLQKKGNIRRDQTEQIKAAGYDIAQGAKKLESYYLDCISKR